MSVGGTTTRVHDFVNRGPEFDAVYLYPLLLPASFRVIGRPFKLSTLHEKTLGEMMRGRGLPVGYVTIFRRAQRHAPEINRRMPHT